MKLAITLIIFISVTAISQGIPSARQGRRGGQEQNRCKYRRGQWGECDATRLKRVRTDTLIPDASTGACNGTRLFEKACKKKSCEYGQWTEYGPCENNRQTKTRPILTGAEEECGGKKAKKTKTCRSNPGGPGKNGQRGGGGGRRKGGTDAAATTEQG